MAEEKKKRKYTITEEERERRRERAKKQVEEGKIGGVQKGAGRPKKQRAQEHVVEKIRENQNKVWKALERALDADSEATALKAVATAMQLETSETELQIKEEQRRFDNMTREQLIEYVGNRIKKLKEQNVDVLEVLTDQAKEVIKVPNLENDN